MFLVKKKFLSGILKGQTTVIKTNVPFKIGKTYQSCVSSASYVILDVVKY